MKRKADQLEQPAWRGLRELEERSGHLFARPSLARLALTHSSFANECGNGMHNERLEFLGDAVLGLCVSEELFRRFPEAREGELTVMYDQLVCEKALANLSRRLGLDQCLALGRGEENQDGRKKDSLLADVFEAWLAAIYLDAGLPAAARFVAAAYADLWPGQPPERLGEKDAKTALQEFCQKTFGALPVYELAQTDGADHDHTFTVRLALPDGRTFLGCAKSIKKAGQAAAASALQEILPGGTPLAGRPSMAQ